MAGILNAELAFPQFPALDQYGPNTTLLLHGDGTNGAQNNTFIDSSANNFTITRNGNTTQGTFSPFSQPNGWWSNYFPADNATYLFVASNSAFNLNTYVCLECWVNFATVGSGGSSALIVGRESSFWIAYDYNGIGGASGKFVFTILNSGSSWQAVSSTTTPVAGQWYHVVGIKDNTTLRIYINGNQENTASFSGSPANTANGISIGSLVGSQGPYKGYVSNARLVISASNVLPYTGNFTPPTTPLTAVTGTALLTCQSNRFVDNSTNAFTVTRNGTPTVQAFKPFSAPTAYYPAVNGGAGYFDGSGDYLSVANNAAFNLGTGDFTIETWLYPFSVNSGNANPVLSQLTSASNTGWLLGMSSGSLWQFSTGNTVIVRAGTVVLNQWTHLAAVRSSGTTNLYVNGISVGSTSTSFNFTDTDSLLVGYQSAFGIYFNGYVSNARIVKGTAVYTANFIPSTTPLTAISNTSILLSFTNAGIIDSVSQNQLETVGNAQVSTTQSKFGGASMYFDASGSYLSFPSNPNVAFGTGDFTIEYWMYSNDVSSSTQKGMLQTSDTAGGLKTTYTTGIFMGQGYTGSGNLDGAIRANINGTNVGSSVAVLTTGAWYHVALVRASGVVTIYVNGNSVATGTVSSSITGTYLAVGGNYSTSYTFNGYIDDFRITAGIARYTQNFTPPQNAYPNYGPLTNIPTVDPNFKNTTLLLHGNGTNGAQNNTFLDSSTNNFTITRNGNTTQGTFTPFSQPNGWWSNKFNGSTDVIYATETSSQFTFGTGDYTYECWIYPTSDASTQRTIFGRTNTGNVAVPYIYLVTTTGVVSVYYSSTIVSGVTAIPSNAWTHIMVSRLSGTTRIFVNGNQEGSAADTTNLTTPTAVMIGGSGTSPTNAFNGYISNARILKGTGYSSITVPTSPLTAITNTSLLTCQSNKFVDNSSNAFAITTSGSPTVQNFYPFFPPLDYSTAAIGGSAYFDGSGDYLSSSIGAIGTGDFTVEYWSYLNVLNSSLQPGYFQISGTSGGLSATYTAGLLAFDNGSLYVNVGGTTIATSHTLVRYQWFHTAIVRSSGTVSVYVNGSLVSTPTSITTNLTGTYIALGGYYSTGYLMTGYLSGFRVLVGTALYTSTFVPPTLPPTAIANTSFLANFTNGGIFDNASKNDLETVGNAQISTTQSKFGGSSMYFNGTTDYLKLPNNPALGMGSGDFTIEAWIYPTTVSPTYQGIFSTTGTSSSDIQVQLNNNLLRFTSYTAQIAITTTTISANVWTHIAVCRSGGTTYLYINGNLGGSGADSTNWVANPANIGAIFNSSYPFSGYMDDFRITNGFARYRYNFTPPAAQFPNK